MDKRSVTIREKSLKHYRNFHQIFAVHIFVMRDLFGINADWVITNNTYENFLMGNKGNALH